MIADARADNKENDVEYMKPGSKKCKNLPLFLGGLDC